MSGTVRMFLLIGAFVAVALIFIAVGESHRRARLNDDSRPDTQAGSQTPNNAASNAKPPVETSAGMLPSAVQRVGDTFKGPASIQISANAQYRVAFGLVSYDDSGKYLNSSDLQAALEHLPCGTGGSGQVSISCEIPAGSIYVLWVADTREPLRAPDGGFVEVRRPKKGDPSSNPSYINSMTFTTTYTPLPAPNAK
jgi:hypothetical protein